MCAPELKRRFTLDTLVGVIDVVDFGGIDHAFLVDHNGQVIFSLDKGQVMTNLKDIYPDRAYGLSRAFRMPPCTGRSGLSLSPQ